MVTGMGLLVGVRDCLEALMEGVLPLEIGMGVFMWVRD